MPAANAFSEVIGKLMKLHAFCALLFVGSVFAAPARADIIDDVRAALSANNFAAAAAQLANYRAQHGDDPLYIEALSWEARAALAANQLDQAQNYAHQTELLAREQLHHRPLDSEPHLPQALGAAIEVEAQVLAANGENARAVALLHRSLATYKGTSIEARLQKNLNLLALISQPAPAFSTAEYLGVRPSSLTQLKGSPVLLFFWAHWCGDCKYEGPIISRLTSEFAPKGLSVLAPTRLYGYAAAGENAKPKDELAYIGQVWQHYYPALQSVAVPVSKSNFNNYGASTTPTLVLIDRKGRVALYHPGLMQYEDLRAAIQKVL
jgi:thiol-disulfide isomerase/thioredoxin